ncbi:MAG: amidohydrolase family protein [Armatimonadota bacterium]
MYTLDDWRKLVRDLPLASSHCHHRPEEVHRELDLATLLNSAYLAWGWRDASVAADRESYVEQFGTNTYFVWLSRAVAHLYNQGEISAKHWVDISAAISDAHASPEHHFRVLKDTCRLKFAVQDSYWNPGDDLGRRYLFRPTYRINEWVQCHGPQVEDHNNNSPWQTEGFAPATLDEYLELCTQRIETAVDLGCVALKSALAYDRTQAFDHPDRAQATKAFGAAPKAATETQKLAFGDVVMHHICGVAGRLGVPLQVHLGLGKIAGSRPMYFEPMIAQYPQTTFDLFHCGYPWTHEIGGLLHVYPNVYADFCWLPLISTTVAVQALHEYLDVAFGTDKLLWGDDCGTAEETYGARLAWEHVVARVMHERVEAGLVGRKAAEKLAAKLMYGNVERLYGG